jgi:hypothetical protein
MGPLAADSRGSEVVQRAAGPHEPLVGVAAYVRGL